MSGQMTGMDAQTGKPLDGTAHLAQSIGDILTTPLGTRVMRRDYGSMLFELLDQPLNELTRMLLRADTGIAINRWEPRIDLDTITIPAVSPDGTVSIEVEGRRKSSRAPNDLIRFSIPLRLSPSA